MGRTESSDKKSLKKTADATEQLVELNKEAGKQTKWIMVLTVMITILTFVMTAPIVIGFIKYLYKEYIG